ncbi:MAG: hypothetical protein J6M35_08525 [Clostridia bacterium]|nr:hypothetical protein [Clostridia bacterium]
MNASKFSNALGNVGESYVDEAVSYTAKKKNKIWKGLVTIAACLALVVSLSVGGAMMFGHEDVEVPENPGADNGEAERPGEKPKYESPEPAPNFTFEDLQSFLKFINSDKNDPSSKQYFNPKFYVDFSPIIYDNEIDFIASYYAKGGDLRVSYSGEDDLSIYYGYGTYGEGRFESHKESCVKKHPKYKVYNTLSDVPENTEFFIYNRDDNYILYETWKSSTVGDGARISFMIGEYYFMLYASLPAETDSEQELLSAFIPELGATDESVIEMLDKIKALIPQ